jgi:hypothetical protein
VDVLAPGRLSVTMLIGVRLVATVLWVTYVACSVWYGNEGEPLLTCDKTGDDCVDISDYQSSGSDDGVLITFGAVIGLGPALVSLWRWRRPIFAGEYVGWALLLSFQVFWLLLIEIGSVYYTIRNDASSALPLWCMSIAGLLAITAVGLSGALKPRPAAG